MTTTKRKSADKRRLSELLVKRARPRAAPFVIWDTKTGGLGLRVRPSGARGWYFVYARRGRSRWLRLGDAKVIPLSDARTMAAEAALAVAKGGDPAAEKIAERGAGTFAEMARKYVEQYAKKHNKSWRQSARLVERYLIPAWGSLQAHTITRSDVKALKAGIGAPVLANQVQMAGSAVFSWALKDEQPGLAVNPFKGVDLNPTASRERVLSDSEIPRFMAAFDQAGLAASSALKTILLTGQRPGEVARMRREHIVDGWWEMPGEPVPMLGWPGTKNSQSHRVWLPGPAQDLLAELDDGQTTGFVFTGGRGTPVRDLDIAMRGICAAIGAERATPHDLRRTHGTMVTRLGFGRDLMNRIQNHKEGGIASVYDPHQYAEETKRAMEKVASAIMALATGNSADNVVPMHRAS
jgi:integrase